ncbi:MAG: antitoxin VbhA family protein [Neisseriaceae bacterium]|nr:antitoxin VbhA family protein [Neisseriaceae bacterium]
MNAQQQQTLNAIRQADAIMALEGFQPTDDMKIVQKAVLSGRTTFRQVINEMRDYVAIHKTIDGFIQTRQWAME